MEQEEPPYRQSHGSECRRVSILRFKYRESIPVVVLVSLNTKSVDFPGAVLRSNVFAGVWHLLLQQQKSFVSISVGLRLVFVAVVVVADL
jgi:hypothetical protein